MIIRSLEDVSGTERDVAGEGWRSRRMLRRDDGMNFSLHWTEVAAGTEMELVILPFRTDDDGNDPEAAGARR